MPDWPLANRPGGPLVEPCQAEAPGGGCCGRDSCKGLGSDHNEMNLQPGPGRGADGTPHANGVAQAQMGPRWKGLGLLCKRVNTNYATREHAQ